MASKYDDSHLVQLRHHREVEVIETNLETARVHLAAAKATHKKINEQISMRTATIASMAAVLMTRAELPSNWKNAADVVKVATEIMVEAETSAGKEKDLQAAKDKR